MMMDCIGILLNMHLPSYGDHLNRQGGKGLDTEAGLPHSPKSDCRPLATRSTLRYLIVQCWRDVGNSWNGQTRISAEEAEARESSFTIELPRGNARPSILDGCH